ncbi:hypothetical protein GCM10018783_50110 [Streptomyces griseosporeus]|nr:hypothetical protein GCM10018783_50110 [Streptomyces griseosporeus]
MLAGPALRLLCRPRHGTRLPGGSRGPRVGGGDQRGDGQDGGGDGTRDRDGGASVAHGGASEHGNLAGRARAVNGFLKNG